MSEQAFQQTEIKKTPEEEKIITVKVKSAVNIDGDRLTPGIQTRVSVKQWRALSRHLEYIEGPKEHAPKGWKAAGAAAIAFLLCLFGYAAQAAPPSTYGNLPLPTMLALLPTNGVVLATNGIGAPGASVACIASQTNTWVSENFTNASGLVYPTNDIAFTKFDEFCLVLSGQTQPSASGFTNTWTFWQGDGSLTNWDTNHPLFTLTLSTTGTNAVLVTNMSRNFLGSSAYLVCGTISALANSGVGTNLTLAIRVKPIRAGVWNGVIDTGNMAFLEWREPFDGDEGRVDPLTAALAPPPFRKEDS